MKHRGVRGGGGLFAPPPSPPAASAQPVADSPNTLRSAAIADVLFALGEGPIPAPDNLYQSVYLDGVPIQSSDGTFNFKNVTATLALGYPDQAYVPGTAAAETASAVGVELTYANPIVRAVTDVSATGGRVAITIPALVQANPTTGQRGPTAVGITIEVQPDGGSYVLVVADVINGKCISPVQFDYDFPLAGTGPWNVRVSRTTLDSTSSDLVNETHWSSLSVVRDYRLAYPDTVMLRVRIDAEQFSGQFPAVEYEGRFLILEIPSNYDPEARTYSGTWDGTFTTGWTDNPAWVLWGLLTNDRWGLGRWIDAADVDKWALYAASQWFDELVDDGAGGLEPRFTFNDTFDSPVKAYDAITTIAGAVQAMPYWESGAAFFSLDRPADSVKLVGRSNAANGKITYEGSDLATRPTAVHATWHDPSNSYQRAIEVSEDPDMIAVHGLRVKEVALAGCTTQGQASRAGRYELLTAWNETQVATWVVGEDQHDLSPGDIVDVADQSVQGRRMTGRVVSVSGTTITLDAAVVIDSGVAYTLWVMGPTGAPQSRSLVTAPMTTAALTLASAFAPAPLVGAVWLLEASNLAPRQFRVISIEEKTGENAYQVMALEHLAGKQASVESGVVLSLPIVSGYGSGPLDPPSGVTIDEGIERLPSGTYRHRITLGWEKHPDPRVVRYEIQHRGSAAQEWDDDGYAVGTTAEIDELGSGGFEFRVRAIAFDGTTSPWTAALSTTLTGLDAPPPDVENFSINIINEVALLAWDPVVIANFSHYELRFSADVAANWESMVPIALKVAGTSLQTAARTGLYGIKAQTAQGIQSTNTTLLVATAAGLTVNIVEVLEGSPDWLGEFDGTVVDGARDALRLAPAADDLFMLDDLFDVDGLLSFEVVPYGTFTWSEIIDLGEVYTSRVSAALEVFGERTTDDIWDEADVWSLLNLWGTDPFGWNAYIEVQTTEDDPSGSSVWSDWMRLVVSDLRFRALKARFVLETTDITVTPIALGDVVIDMPDRIDAQGELAIDVGGTRVSFLQAFRGPARPSVVITGIEGAAAGDWADVSNVDPTGFDITIKNGATPQSGRSIDYHAKGYGAVVA